MSPPIAAYLVSFLGLCLVASFVMNAVRLREPRAIAVETVRLFLTIAVGILVFAAAVWGLECIFIRPLL